jgi:hypothetical protein
MAERSPFKQEDETPRLYLDSTILIAYTLTSLIEKERHADVVAMIEKINAGEIVALTSFYALHEVLVFALRNVPNLELGIRVGKISKTCLPSSNGRGMKISSARSQGPCSLSTSPICYHFRSS